MSSDAPMLSQGKAVTGLEPVLGGDLSERHFDITDAMQELLDEIHQKRCTILREHVEECGESLLPIKINNNFLVDGEVVLSEESIYVPAHQGQAAQNDSN